MIIVNNTCFTCDCDLKNLPEPYILDEEKRYLHESKRVFKCNKCKCIVEPEVKLPVADGMTSIENMDVHGYCNTCFAFVKKDEVYGDFMIVKYKISKEPYLNYKCEKCHQTSISSKVGGKSYRPATIYKMNEAPTTTSDGYKIGYRIIEPIPTGNDTNNMNTTKPSVSEYTKEQVRNYWKDQIVDQLAENANCYVSVDMVGKKTSKSTECLNIHKTELLEIMQEVCDEKQFRYIISIAKGDSEYRYSIVLSILKGGEFKWS